MYAKNETRKQAIERTYVHAYDMIADKSRRHSLADKCREVRILDALCRKVHINSAANIQNLDDCEKMMKHYANEKKRSV